MKSILLTGINGTVAQAMKKQLDGRYEVSGISMARMEDVLEEKPTTWKQQMDSYRERVMEQLTTACRGKDAIVHHGWNTRDENWQAGLDPLNIMLVDCVYQAAIAENVPRIYMTSSVHSYDFMGDGFDEDAPIPPTPDTRRDPFGTRPTSLYGVSKRWMEIGGQFYAPKLSPEQKILVVRLGAVNASGEPSENFARLWYSHEDMSNLLAAFIECDDAPNFWITYGVSNNLSDAHPTAMFDTVNPYGFTPKDNAFDRI
ncbi:MAG: NAD(P)-dependent oxidoreductase [Gemmatimonadetes bacterium]|jgi:nucleoside-diphosphate-sugar epimerase|nr:NAD(P)-dependent oxidoreductase [Gemmatimonadota bacterium]MBT5057049.1 NAD(P)-dependent oxidoreductase [Gemmatimonadota bacterium]MBT5146828.1 NAD(P)-dependent oxidoreductase [Gemmatimonadota bacterium]MBT5590117.1 NAD(P)-dependent oxidoreductase [Gemmatimonadota bacterium]MBT5961688.1 NAD(P)-dependent oxidoreductase [Gemmatimonadota bacterium]